MRKHFRVLLIGALVLATGLVVSCDSNFRNTLANMMGGLSNNIYEDMHMATPNTEAANAAINVVSQPSTTTVSSVSNGSITVTLDADKQTIVQPLSAEESDAISNALESNTTSANLLKKELSAVVDDQETIKAVNNTAELVGKLLTAVGSSSLGADTKALLGQVSVPTNQTSMTKLDVLSMKMVSGTLQDILSVLSDATATDEQKRASLNRAIQTYKNYKALTGMDNGIFSTEMVSSLLKGTKGLKSTNVTIDDSLSDSLSMINGFAKEFFGAMVNEEGNVTAESYAHMHNTYNAYYSLFITLDSVIKDMNGSSAENIEFLKGVDLGVNDLAHYALACAERELPKVYTDQATLVSKLNSFVNDNKKLASGTLAVGDSISVDGTYLTDVPTKVSAYAKLTDTNTTWQTYWSVLEDVCTAKDLTATVTKYSAKVFEKESGKYKMVNDMLDKLADWDN